MGSRKTGKKAISSVLSVVTILLVVTGLSGASFTFLINYFTGVTSRNLVVQNVFSSTSGSEIYIKNEGTDPIPLTDVKIVDTITGDDATGTWTSGGVPIVQLEPGKLAKFSTVCSGQCKYRFVYGGATTMSVLVQGTGCVGAGTCIPGFCQGISDCSGYTIDSCTDNPCDVSATGCHWNSTNGSCEAGGNIYYLDAVNGDDNNPGTSIAPWKTFARAMHDWSGDGVKVIPGDIVELRNGSYGSIASGVGHSDMFGGWVTYKAAKDALPEIVNIMLGLNGAVYYGVNHTGSYDVYMRFKGIHFTDGIVLYGPRHLAFEDCLIERVGPWHGSDANIEKNAVRMRGGNDITVSGCEITRTGTGISMRGHNITIRNNHIHNITHDGIRSMGLWDSLVEGNRIHGLDDGLDDSSGLSWNRHCDGIHIFIQGTTKPEAITTNHNITFRGNVIYDCEAQGVQFNNYPIFPDLRNNNITFENNIFGPTRSNAFNNADPVDGLIFRHNTFVHFPGGRDYTSMFRTIHCGNHNLRITGTSTDVHVYNNILVSFGGRGDWNIIQSPVANAPYDRFTLLDPNPQVENPDAFDGKLLTTSLAIDAGTRFFATTPIYESDRKGTSRDERPDMGAYEVPGRSPPPEVPPQSFPGTKTVFGDDFEDADLEVDPWLEGAGRQGLSWYHPNATSPKYRLQGDGAMPNPNNELTGFTQATSSWIFSTQGSNWSDYSIGFNAHNAFLTIGAGPLLLVNDTQNCYWLDISRDNGRLIRFMNDSAGNPTMTVLATSSAIEMPHSGNRRYNISVRHDAAGINFTVDADGDGSVDLTYVDNDPLAISRFPAGKIGFHKDYPNQYHRLSYDDIVVNVTRFS